MTDDSFFTLGSANLNLRGVAVDAGTNVGTNDRTKSRRSAQTGVEVSHWKRSGLQSVFANSVGHVEGVPQLGEFAAGQRDRPKEGRRASWFPASVPR
ncbi:MULTISPECIES: hypothetical protein [Burkholderia]|uniref:hypothetical protein n=1 Tax=Burkholderia TaxID=32008 RepID=UPI001D11EF7F|nr:MULTISPECIES: hypothetical protein [Burkholderia]